MSNYHVVTRRSLAVILGGDEPRNAACHESLDENCSAIHGGP
jgi:hypothetical protein